MVHRVAKSWTQLSNWTTINYDGWWVLFTQSCLTLCDPMDCSPPGFSVHGILQARILECVAISFSRGSSRPRDQTHVSCIAGGLFTTEPPGKPHSKFTYILLCLSFFFLNHSLTGVFVCLLKKRFSFLKSLKIVATYNLKKDLEPPPMLLSQELCVE